MARKLTDEELAAKRQSAAYTDKIDKLRRSDESMSDAEMDKVALRAVDLAVYGFDAKQDRHGNWLDQGIGSKGHETINHFAAIRRWRGEREWEAAVHEIWDRDPKRAEALRLPRLAKKEKDNA
jgi:hypothetical protein